MPVVVGNAAYSHSSCQYMWDHATPGAFARGFRASRFEASQLCDDSPNRWLPYLLSVRRDLVGAVIALSKEATRWAH
jgi:hypothetical protein